MTTTLLAYIILAGSLLGFAACTLVSDPQERRTHLAQLFAALFVGALLLLVSPAGQ
jgi:hypothetical protein